MTATSGSLTVHMTLRGVTHRLACDSPEQATHVQRMASQLEASLRHLADNAPHASDVLLLMMHALMLQDSLNRAEMQHQTAHPSVSSTHANASLSQSSDDVTNTSHVPHHDHTTHHLSHHLTKDHTSETMGEVKAATHAMAAVTDYLQDLLDRYPFFPMNTPLDAISEESLCR